MQHYLYDASGERVLKASTDSQQVYQNGELISNDLQFGNYTIYQNAFTVVDPYGIVSKHYYAGSQRIVSRLVNPEAIQKTTEPDTTDYNYKTQQQAHVTKAGSGKVQFAKPQTTTIKDAEKEAVPIITQPDAPRPRPQPMYFYHPDHLGTSTFLTDSNGNAYQIEDSSNTIKNKYSVR